MALICGTHPALQQSQCQFWRDELENAKILLFDVNEKIKKLEIENYSYNSGQTAVSSKRSDLNALMSAREKLLQEIRELESALGIGNMPQLVQAAPSW